MGPEIFEVVKYLASAAVGAGLTIAAVAKFGQSIFFKHLDHTYAEKLALKNSELQRELEQTKNALNRSLQQDVARYKSDLEVLSGQRSRFLQRKIDSILELNKLYVMAIKKLRDFVDINHTYIDEAASYFILQAEEPNFTQFSDYSVFESIKREHWPKHEVPADSAIEKYAEFLALKMPILPEEFTKNELKLVESLRETMEVCSSAFYRTMGLTSEIIEPEEDMTVEECLKEFKEKVSISQREKEKVEAYSTGLLEKAKGSGKLIDSMLET